MADITSLPMRQAQPHSAARHTFRQMMLRITYLAGCCISLTACVQPTKLSNGQYSGLQDADNAIRMGLPIDASASPPVLSYPSTETCNYQENMTFVDGTRVENLLKISVQPVKDKAYFVMDRNGDTLSGYLMSHTGKLYDFNSQSVSTGERYNKEKFEHVGQELLAKPHSPISRSSTVLSEFAIEFPEYRRQPRALGDGVAIMWGQDGAVWAHYQYAGITNYHGVQAAVFDIVREVPGQSSYGAILVGFSIVDIRTAMPVLLVYRQASSIRLN